MRGRKSAPSADFMTAELQVIESGARRNLRDEFVQPPAFYNRREMKPRDSKYLPKSHTYLEPASGARHVVSPCQQTHQLYAS